MGVMSLEDRLRRAALNPISSTECNTGGANGYNASGCANGGSGSEEVRSDASTAAPPMPAKDSLLQEKAKALERDIRNEAAAALELQDRIHWLRGQLRRQPGVRNDGVAEIADLLRQTKEQLSQMTLVPSPARSAR